MINLNCTAIPRLVKKYSSDSYFAKTKQSMWRRKLNDASIDIAIYSYSSKTFLYRHKRHLIVGVPRNPYETVHSTLHHRKTPGHNKCRLATMTYVELMTAYATVASISRPLTNPYLYLLKPSLLTMSLLYSTVLSFDILYLKWIKACSKFDMF